jgi:hypothetical protein
MKLNGVLTTYCIAAWDISIPKLMDLKFVKTLYCHCKIRHLKFELSSSYMLLTNSHLELPSYKIEVHAKI